jgi:adenylate cyclase
MNFFKELKRRNVFKVAAAYMIVGWLIMQVGETLGPALLLPEWINSALAFFIILGFPLALFFAWAFEMTPEGIKKEKDVDRGESITQVTSQKLNNIIIGLLVLALGYFAFDKFVLDPERDAEMVEAIQQATPESVPTESEGPAVDDKSIAVLPFVNMSDDASNEYFSDGITEELLNLLAKIPELKVTSRSSAFAFKGQNIHIPTVAEKLRVKHVLEGSVRKAGNRVRITAQLIEAGSDVHMWSETYDRELDDVFAIQDEIAREVVTVLQVQLLGEAPLVAETSSEAYSYYLQGKHFYAMSDRIDTKAATEAFRKALEIDPEYAPAWAALARTQRSRANWGEVDNKIGTEQAREYAIKALELDDTLADAWAMLARIQWVYDWDWNLSEGTVKTALLHGPKEARVLETASIIARSQGRFEDALAYAQQAVDVDPLNPYLLRTLALTYWQREEPDLCLEIFDRGRTLFPERSGANSNLALCLAGYGRAEEALAYAQLENADTFKNLSSAFALHELGRHEEAKQALQYVVDNDGHWLAYQIAEAFSFMGDNDASFLWLEDSYEKRDGGINYLVGDTFLKNLHNDPRWEPFLLKVGLLDQFKQLQARRRSNS